MTVNEQKLVEENLNLVHYFLHKKAWIRIEDYEDYFQNGVFGLCLAAKRFDESKEIQFSTFASVYIDGYIKKHHRDFAQGPIRPTRSSFKINNKPEYLHIDGLINENGDCYGYDLIVGEKNIESDVIENLDLKRFRYQLSEKENLIIDLSLANLGQTKIGKILGVSQAQVSRIKTKLRKKFEKNGMV